MVHLICLRCNRANASEAKFCGECGAGLLRKFCSECHAVNDAESHFCQSCGAALSAHPSVPPPSHKQPPLVIPDLTDVYRDADEAPPPMVTAELDMRGIDEVPAPDPQPAVDEPSFASAKPTTTHRTPVLYGFVGGAAVLLLAALWSRTDHPSVPTPDAGATASQPVAAPAAATAMTTTVPPAPSPATAAVDTAPRAAAADASTAAPRLMEAVNEPNKPLERHPTPEALIAARPPAAGPAQRSGPLQRAPTARSAAPAPRAAAPAPECTSQVDALGLCAPGAKVAGK